MPAFITFRNAVTTKLNQMYKECSALYYTKATADELYEKYLSSFPAGTNNLFRERTEHDCSACRSFIRQLANVVGVKNGELVSVWDIDAEGFYQDVAHSMSAFVKSREIDSPFLTEVSNIGTEKNFESKDDGTIQTWNHFFTVVPGKFVSNKIGELSGLARTHKEVLGRSVTEITDSAIDTVLELIAQNNLYNGATFKGTVTALKKAQTDYRKAANKELFLWTKSQELGAASSFRNTAIGTLLQELSEGMEIDEAVKRFEKMVAPENYKRPTAVVTKAMIENAEKKVQELQIEPALYRRYATLTDITINNLLFADRNIKPVLGVFDAMKESATTGKPESSKVTDISIDDFIANVLPTATAIEVYVENKHVNNFVSLVAPVYSDAASILKWNNNFSWSYEGEVTDSIKEKVKAAGGNVNGCARVSLEWFNYDDLDLSVIEPNGNRIYFGSRTSNHTGGTLDVDENAGGRRTRTPVENIIYTNRSKMLKGNYEVVVHNFSKRETSNVGYRVQIELDGKVYDFSSTTSPRDSERKTVAKFSFDPATGFHINGTVAQEIPKEVWGISTCSFRKVNAVMLSPNYWDGQEAGNKHYFFMLDKCVNPEQTRGFYNEFLKPELNEHRKVFEMLGSKLKTPVSDNQLSGLGFSFTQRNELICRVTGAFTRTLKIKF